jgi:hypothetical protein
LHFVLVLVLTPLRPIPRQRYPLLTKLVPGHINVTMRPATTNATVCGTLWRRQLRGSYAFRWCDSHA